MGAGGGGELWLGALGAGEASGGLETNSNRPTATDAKGRLRE